MNDDFYSPQVQPGREARRTSMDRRALVGAFVGAAAVLRPPSAAAQFPSPGEVFKRANEERNKINGAAIQEAKRRAVEVERERKKAEAAARRAHRESTVQTNAVQFEAWLRRSRDDARRGSEEIPAWIRGVMSPFYDFDLVARTRYKVGNLSPYNAADLATKYGTAIGVTLIDTIVFKQASLLNDIDLWAHELAHIRQFHTWGTRDFAIRYLRDYESVESQASSAARKWRKQFDNPPSF